jgi:hypothetical protein
MKSNFAPNGVFRLVWLQSAQVGMSRLVSRLVCRAQAVCMSRLVCRAQAGVSRLVCRTQAGVFMLTCPDTPCLCVQAGVTRLMCPGWCVQACVLRLVLVCPCWCVQAGVSGLVCQVGVSGLVPGWFRVGVSVCQAGVSGLAPASVSGPG